MADLTLEQRRRRRKELLKDFATVLGSAGAGTALGYGISKILPNSSPARDTTSAVIGMSLGSLIGMGGRLYKWRRDPKLRQIAKITDENFKRTAGVSMDAFVNSLAVGLLLTSVLVGLEAGRS